MFPSLFLCVRIYLFRNLSLSLFIFVHPCVSQSVSFWCLRLSVSICLSVFLCLSGCLGLSLSLCVRVRVCRLSLFLCVFVVSLCLFSRVRVCLFGNVCLYLSLSLSFYLFVLVFAGRFIKMAYLHVAVSHPPPPLKLRFLADNKTQTGGILSNTRLTNCFNGILMGDLLTNINKPNI